MSQQLLNNNLTSKERKHPRKRVVGFCGCWKEHWSTYKRHRCYSKISSYFDIPPCFANTGLKTDFFSIFANSSKVSSVCSPVGVDNLLLISFSKCSSCWSNCWAAIFHRVLTPSGFRCQNLDQATLRLCEHAQMLQEWIQMQANNDFMHNNELLREKRGDFRATDVLTTLALDETYKLNKEMFWSIQQ